MAWAPFIASANNSQNNYDERKSMKPPANSPSDFIPISPALEKNLEDLGIPQPSPLIDQRTLFICAMAILVALASALAAQCLTMLIGLITNLAFYGKFSTAFSSPAENHLGLWVIPIPILGAFIVGLMARYGSPAIRGHGIPEAMQQIAFHQSKISPRLTFLKPVSTAIAIGTGGPFGAEGPIIATGGALGSLLGQILRITDDERKILLASGAAAGMAAIFLSPISAVILAIELLLFEYKPRSVIPVALASATATGISILFNGNGPVFSMPSLEPPAFKALLAYLLIGAILGLLSVFITKAVYYVEELFEKLPIHWMWWPMIGAVAVGLIGYVAPRTLGVGYNNIEDILSGSFTLHAVAVLVGFKFLSWLISLSSGTSGGTLAPLFTLGGGVGSALGGLIQRYIPHWGVDIRISALVGMAAIFAGASRAFLASILFAFETTRQPIGLLPLLLACSAAYLISCLCMKHSIMTEKLARRGTPLSTEYSVDALGHLRVKDWATREVFVLSVSDKLESVRAKISEQKSGSHQGFPVLSQDGQLRGLLTLRDLFNEEYAGSLEIGELLKRPPIVVFEDNSLREALHQMVKHRVGRLAVVSRENPRRMAGILSRSDILSAHEPEIRAAQAKKTFIDLRLLPFIGRKA